MSAAILVKHYVIVKKSLLKSDVMVRHVVRANASTSILAFGCAGSTNRGYKILN